jgi:hypothetical protein
METVEWAPGVSDLFATKDKDDENYDYNDDDDDGEVGDDDDRSGSGGSDSSTPVVAIVERSCRRSGGTGFDDWRYLIHSPMLKAARDQAVSDQSQFSHSQNAPPEVESVSKSPVFASQTGTPQPWQPIRLTTSGWATKQ